MNENYQFDKVILGDCLTELKKVPSESIDLVVTSPPYNIGKEYEQRKALDNYLDEQAEVIQECYRVLKPTGSIFWQVGSYTNNGASVPLDVKFYPIFEALGMFPRNRIIWVRQHGLHANNRFSGRHETILWFTKSDDYKFRLDDIRVPQKYQNKKAYRGKNKGELSSNPDGKNPSDLWFFRNVKHNHEEQTIHPAQFPEDLIARIVLSTTEEGDYVLDPYMGVATTAVVAKDYRRHYLGFELDPTYHKVALHRISGTPDANNVFPNLKTLRQYVERTGTPIEKYSFTMQIGNKATTSEKSKIYSEEHHADEFFSRLAYEEAYFAAKVTNQELPDDTGFVYKPKTDNSKPKTLFDN